MKNKLIVILFIFTAGLLSAQQTFRETKSFSKEFAYKPGEEIKINGERTFISITRVQSNKVSAEIEVVSRYSDQVQATADLEKIKVRIDKKGKTIYYSNSLEINSPQDRPKSNLKTILKLYVPAYAEVEISNAYGELNLNGSIAKIKSTSQFCNTKCSEFNGDLEIESKYGSIECLNSNMVLKAKGNRSDLILTNTGGSIEAEVKYGSIDVSYSPYLDEIDIKGEHSPITIIVPEVLKASMVVKCKYCNINIDNCKNISDEKISNKEHVIFLEAPIKKKVKAILTSEKEDIKIITTNTFTNSN